MTAPLQDEALDTLFRSARTFNAWQDRDVADATLQKLYNLMKMAPTSANCQPVRLVFVKGDAAKQRLKPLLAEGNQDKSMAAPVTVIVAYDSRFYEHLPTLFPHTDAKSWFEGQPEKIAETAFRNGSLQGAYLIMAARALGLDCGPMSGFDADGVNQAFFPDGRYQANFLVNLGYGDSAGMHERAPRLTFDEACTIL
ncbi:malonic semialdehyde reductase [Methylonatrum kenyense]|uniref:malonic semialdehyde reductase n=1 Tax=Methylonatrum kenyense TaxID=455253 RepID=UPI0020BDFDCA|nr:malonic semialdehyde reductase [Methylonatrum kenyense]MCK8517330.1 malonic semialdehyde reductase [Methylonatrum kenyense]